MNQIPLTQIPGDQPTSYIGGGRTRYPDNSVPHISQVLTVGRIGGLRWRLAPAALADWLLVQTDVEAAGGELVRLTEAQRDQATTQAELRQRYEAWVAAGRPAPERSDRWNPRTMSTAYACRPGESFHGCGMSVDLDVGALSFPDCARGSNEALGKFWTIAAVHGWRPIIAEHDVHLSESWHFDHVDPLRPVRDLLEANGVRPSYGPCARVANALAGTLPRSEVKDITIAYVQARLLVAGFWAGAVDGVYGPTTKAALKAAGVTLPARPTPEDLVALLNQGEIGSAQIEAL